jgi:ribose transport system substrate-binding protein
MRTWRRAMIIGIGCALAHLVGCGGASNTGTGAERQRPLIGVSLLTQSHTFYKDLEAALRAEASTRGLDLTVVACEMDPAKQASQIEDFIAQKVSAILVAPCDSSAVVPHLKAAQQAGIPVFSADIAVNGLAVISHIASDNVEGGRLAARTLAGLLNGKGKVLIIDHPEVASVQDRTRGFDEEMQKHPGITVVGRPSASGQRAKAMSVMEDMLQAHRDIAGIFAINDDSALGAVAVLKAANRNDVVVVGFDATDEAVNMIRAGSQLKADIAQYPKKIGQMSIEYIARHLQGEKVPALVPVQVDVVNEERLRQQ